MVVGLTLSGCATMNVSSHVVRGLDFTQYHSWKWAPADAVPATDARLDNPFFQDNFQGAVEREMSKRGLVQTHSDAEVPDLLVHYHANVMPSLSVSNADATVGACYDEDCSVRVIESETGTMMIDVIDARTESVAVAGMGADRSRRRARAPSAARSPNPESGEGHVRAVPALTRTSARVTQNQTEGGPHASHPTHTGSYAGGRVDDR